MKRRFRLSKRSDFERVRRSGKSYAHPLIVLIVHANNRDCTRFGIVAGRSVGKAVKRNLAKRRIRAALSPLCHSIQAGSDVLILARYPINQASFTELQLSLQKLLKKAGLLL